jgi:hypothetical protein
MTRKLALAGAAPAGPGRRTAPEEVWAAAPAGYVAGRTGPEVCRRYGLGIRTLRKRAAREGWRRADQPWIPPNRLDALDEGVALEDRIEGELDRLEYHQLAHVADCRMMRAVLRGDAAEALRWARVRDRMKADDAEIQRLLAQERAVEHSRVGYAELDALDAAKKGA